MISDTDTGHFILLNGYEILFRAWETASRKVEDLTISGWVERYRIVLPESGSPWPGPFKNEWVPYLREPQDCLHPDHPARRVSSRWSAQLGKSTAIENWFCYLVDRAPCSMMIVLPTQEEAVKFNRIKLAPTIEVTPRIAHKVLPVNSRDEQGSTTAFKRFAGGFCQIVNAGSSKGMLFINNMRILDMPLILLNPFSLSVGFMQVWIILLTGMIALSTTTSESLIRHNEYLTIQKISRLQILLKIGSHGSQRKHKKIS